MLVAISGVFVGIHAVCLFLSGYQLHIERHFESAKLTDIQIVMPRAIVVAALLQIAFAAVAISSQVQKNQRTATMAGYRMTSLV